MTTTTPQTQSNRTPVQGYPVGTGHQVQHLVRATRRSGREQRTGEPGQRHHIAGVRVFKALQHKVFVPLRVQVFLAHVRQQAFDQRMVRGQRRFFFVGQLDQGLGVFLMGTHKSQTVKVKKETPTVGCSLYRPEGQIQTERGANLWGFVRRDSSTGNEAKVQSFSDLTKCRAVLQNAVLPMTIADIQGLYVLATILPRAAWYYCPTLAGRVSQYFFVLFFLSFFCFSPTLSFGKSPKTPNTGIAKGYPATVLRVYKFSVGPARKQPRDTGTVWCHLYPAKLARTTPITKKM